MPTSNMWSALRTLRWPTCILSAAKPELFWQFMIISREPYMQWLHMSMSILTQATVQKAARGKTDWTRACKQ